MRAFATGGVDYLTKPFQMEELRARVETHLNLRCLQVELEEANARLAKANGRMSRDLKAAAKIQETFLPREAPRVAGTEFAWAYRPCDELAGDGLEPRSRWATARSASTSWTSAATASPRPCCR